MTTATATAPRGTSNGKAPPTQLLEIPVDRILIGDNVRVDVGDVSELAASIAESGILQPLRVELGAANDDGQLYLLTIGHRRLAAAKEAGLSHVPAIVDGAVQLGASRIVQQLVENIQRRDLNSLEEAKALRRILDASKGMTQEQLAATVGRSRPAVTNLLRILELDPKVQELVASGKLSGAHAKALVGLKVTVQRDLANEAVSRHWSSHDLEREVGYKQRQAKANEDRKKEAVAKVDAIEALLVKRGAEKRTAQILVHDYSGMGIADKLSKRGWQFFKTASRNDIKKCGCTAFTVDSWGLTPSVKAVCISEEHWRANEATAEAARAAQREEEARQAAEEQARLEADRAPIVALITGNQRRADRLMLYVLAESTYGPAIDDFWTKISDEDRREAAWATIDRLTDDQVAHWLPQLLADQVLEEYPGSPVRAAFAADPPAKPKRAKKAAAE